MLLVTSKPFISLLNALDHSNTLDRSYVIYDFYNALGYF
jgi:hypothetical protein